MPAGYSPRCKACNSSLRVQLEKWKDDGDNTSQISIKLKERGENISRPALDNHFEKHYNVSKEVQEQYFQSQANLQEEASERISEIQMLDDVALEKYQLHTKLTKIIGKLIKGLEDSKDIAEFPKLPAAYVTLYTDCAAEIRQALKTKQELLGEDGNTKKANAIQNWVDLMLEDE